MKQIRKQSKSTETAAEAKVIVTENIKTLKPFNMATH